MILGVPLFFGKHPYVFWKGSTTGMTQVTVIKPSGGSTIKMPSWKITIAQIFPSKKNYPPWKTKHSTWKNNPLEKGGFLLEITVFLGAMLVFRECTYSLKVLQDDIFVSFPPKKQCPRFGYAWFLWAKNHLDFFCRTFSFSACKTVKHPVKSLFHLVEGERWRSKPYKGQWEDQRLSGLLVRKIFPIFPKH